MAAGVGGSMSAAGVGGAAMAWVEGAGVAWGVAAGVPMGEAGLEFPGEDIPPGLGKSPPEKKILFILILKISTIT